MPSKIVDNRRVPVLIPNTEMMMVPSGDTWLYDFKTEKLRENGSQASII